MFSRPEDPIGIFDSGVGGLTVMREMVRQLPHEDVVYFGDTEKFPYGDKSPSAVLRYTLDKVSFLLEKKIKLLVVACFTASSHALEVLEQKLSIPVIGVIQSGFEELLTVTQSKRIAILGTASTIQSGVLQSLIAKRDSSIAVFPVACPLFAPLIEEGLVNHPATEMIVQHYLRGLSEKKIDSVLLACTHYPLIRPIIQRALGSAQLIEPAKNCALKAQSLLTAHNLLNLQKAKPFYEFYVSDNPEKFRRLTRLFFGSEIKKVQEFKS